MDPAERLRPYVAGLAATWCEAMPEVRHRGVSGTLAFVDISGFTTLTERLAAKGKVGAEEMSDLLNEAFATLLKVAYGYGASLVKWGGDAVLLLFEGDDHAAQGCRAALEMQRTMRRIGRLRTSVGVVALKMSVGISSGRFDFFLVGDRHRELVVVGPSATETAVMEQIAEAGEVVVSAATAALLPQGCLGPAKETGWLLRTPPPADPRSRWWPRVGASYVATCLDPALREHLLAEVGDSEHRQVAVGFVEVSGIDGLLEQQGPAATAGALHLLMNVVQEACAHHRITFWETDISKDGFKILLIGGAPKTSGHDEDAMVRAGRWILDTYSGPVRLRIGVNSGRVFNGGFGPPFRRTWSVKGDAVNLAARVMGKAESGQLLATEALLRRVQSRVDADLLPPFMVKGKRQPVHAAVVHRVSVDHAVDADRVGAFVGRRREIDLLLDAARAAAERRGGALAIVGDAGIGKSRLVDHACRRFPETQKVLRGFADSYESATPYYTVRRVLLAAIGMSQDATDELVARELRRRASTIGGQLVPFLPLLATPFGVELPDTPESAQVKEQFRRPRTLGLVVELLAAVLSTSSVFVVDDVQYADDASAELIARFASEAKQRQWLVIVVGRELPTSLRHPDVEEVVVPPLSAQDAHELVVDEPGGALLQPHVIRAILDRAEGNPLFLRELTSATTATDADDLPSTLEELLSARIDDLSPDQRRLLRTVSVLGTRFDEESATALLDRTPTKDDWTSLEHFLALHADGTRRFRTGLAREAAYEGLPFRRRIELHGQAASRLEGLAASDGEDRAEALSLHCLAAQRYADAWRYSLLGGRRAQRVYANAEALTLLNRARDAARHLPEVPPLDLAELGEAIGDVSSRLGELTAAVSAYMTARARAPRSAPLVRARLAMHVGRCAEASGQMTRALQWLTKAHRDLQAVLDEDSGDQAAAALAGRIWVERAHLRFLNGRTAEAARLCELAVDAAQVAGADEVVGRALFLLDAVDMRRGRSGDEKRVLLALDMLERAGDLPAQANVWNHLGARAYFAGDWPRAIECYQKTRDIDDRCGNDWGAAIASGNIGEIYVDQGRLVEARPLLDAALRVWRAAGATSSVGFGAALLGRLHARSGSFPDAMALFQEALSAYAAKDEQFDIVQTELKIAEALLLQGGAAAALRQLDRADKRLRLAAAAAGLDPVESPESMAIARLRALAFGQQGDMEGCARALQQSAGLAAARGWTHELAVTLNDLVAAGMAEPDQQSAAGDLLSQLGVVWVPNLLAHPAREQADLAAVMADLPRPRARSAVRAGR